MRQLVYFYFQLICLTSVKFLKTFNFRDETVLIRSTKVSKRYQNSMSNRSKIEPEIYGMEEGKQPAYLFLSLDACAMVLCICNRRTILKLVSARRLTPLAHLPRHSVMFFFQGIPPNDLKEHERQKQGTRGNDSGSDDDEPSQKKVKQEGLLGNAPGVMQGMPGMMQGMMPPPGMPPGIPMGHMMPMGPHFAMHPG